MTNISRQVLTALDADEVGRLCGAAPRTIRHWKKFGIPAAWKQVIQSLCASRGVPCPDDAFKFKWATPADAEQTEGAA